MSPLRFFRRFAQDQSGAVTVDWVVLSGAIVGLGIASYGVVAPGISNLSTDVSSQMRGFSIQSSFERAPTDQVMNLDSATGYRDLDFYFFNATGIDRFYGRMKAMSDAELQAEIKQRVPNVAFEDVPWGNTDMYNIAAWEAARRGIDHARPKL